MPYNKGDFTQQGINGDVSALVRLNEKRVMKVVLSSDDESDNCDISGAVYDLLNGTSYSVGSAPSGTIEITANGTGIDVSQYALADVNVSGGGDSDFTTAQLTVTGNPGLGNEYLPIVTVNPDYSVEGAVGTMNLGSGSPYTVILYKGKCYAPFSNVATTSGSITYNDTLSVYEITGDCSITFSSL